MTTGATLFICRRENLGSHQMKSDTSAINGAACIDRSAESGVTMSSAPAAIPEVRDSADTAAAEANSSGAVLGVVSGEKIKEGAKKRRDQWERV